MDLCVVHGAERIIQGARETGAPRQLTHTRQFSEGYELTILCDSLGSAVDLPTGCQLEVDGRRLRAS